VPFEVVVPPEVLAMAELTAAERPKNIKHHRPSKDPHADLVGALAEHAFAYHCGIPQRMIDSSGGPTGRGDGGKDFEFRDGKVKVDVKASRHHPESWTVPGVTPLQSDWYVFAYVILPDRVIFQGKAHRSVLEPMVVGHPVEKKRLVYLTEITDIRPDDFKKTIPRRPKEAVYPHLDRQRTGKRVPALSGA
jgi:hypothetical protein